MFRVMIRIIFRFYVTMKTMKKILSLACFCILLFSGRSVFAAERVGTDLFVSVLQKPLILCDRAAMDQLFSDALAANVQTIFMQVYRANQSWFPSRTADESPYQECRKTLGEDPLGLFINKAHANAIQVHAWFNVLSLSRNDQAPLLSKYGWDILTRNRETKTSLWDYAVDNQLFLEPGDPNVRAELITILEELLKGYPGLDGVQFDYIRYPDSTPFYGHTPVNEARFKKSSAGKKIVDSDPEWKEWKRNQVTELLQRMVIKARVLSPNLRISTTSCTPFVRAYEECFQNWPSWVNSGLIDFVTVMAYARDPAEFDRYVLDSRGKIDDPTRMKIAVGAYKLGKSPEIFATQMHICRSASSGSCVVFHYGSVLESPALKRELEKKP